MKDLRMLRIRMRKLMEVEPSYSTPLANAIRGKHTEIVGIMLASEHIEVYPVCHRENSKTVLHMAAESKEITIIQLLLKRPEIDFKRESDAFKTAIDFDLHELLNLFLNHEKFDDLLTIKPFESYLQGSVRYGSKGISLRVLLDSG
eukprot:701044_1